MKEVLSNWIYLYIGFKCRWR